MSLCHCQVRLQEGRSTPGGQVQTWASVPVTKKKAGYSSISAGQNDKKV